MKKLLLAASLAVTLLLPIQSQANFHAMNGAHRELVYYITNSWGGQAQYLCVYNRYNILRDGTKQFVGRETVNFHTTKCPAIYNW